MHILELIDRVDLPLLDQQISTLHVLEVSSKLSEREAIHISGLCEFLIEFYETLLEDSNS